MTIKKLLRQQIFWVEFLSRLNFVISYTPDRENRKANSLTCQPNNYLVDNCDDQQQHLLKTILLSKRIEISSIDLDKSKTTSKKVIQANLTDLYCIKLRETISPYFPVDSINTFYLSDLSIDIRGCIRRFNRFWVLDHLQLMLIEEVHNQITINHPDYQKTVSLIT